MSKERKKKPLAVIYLRVSSAKQVKGESLETQESTGIDYAKFLKCNFKVFTDEGISGRSMAKRHGLVKAMNYAINKGAKYFIVYSVSRLGRNAEDILKNHRKLKNGGVTLISLKEKIDFSTDVGKIVLTVLAGIAEWQSALNSEYSLENRYLKAKNKKVPTSGRKPFGRVFVCTKRENKKCVEGHWDLVPEKAEAIEFAAREIIKGRSVRATCKLLETEFGIKISRGSLRNVFKKYSGDTWTENFKGYGKVTHKVPALLDEFTIRAVNKQLSENKRPIRTDVKNYVLNKHMHCTCGLGLSGATVTKPNGKKYPYYVHPSGTEIQCKGYRGVPLKKADDAVLDTLFNFTYDQASFQRAVKERIGDKKDTAKLKRQITKNKKSRSSVERQLSNLVDMLSSEKITESEYDKKRADYLEKKSNLIEKIAKQEGRLQSWLESEKFMEDASEVRHKLLEEIESPEHIKNMTYEQKSDLLDYFFNGWDDDGNRYGITVQKNAQGEFEFELYGRYLMGPDRYDTLKRRRAIYTFKARKTLGKDGFDLEKRKERVSKSRYNNMSASSGP
jgi:DNA invertase Pin-like site-specific DNA recombinase